MKLPGSCYNQKGAEFKSRNLWYHPKEEDVYGPEYYTYFEGECVYHKGCWSVFQTKTCQWDFVYRGHTVTQRAGFSDPTIIDRINDRTIEDKDGSLERVREKADKVDNMIEGMCANG